MGKPGSLDLEVYQGDRYELFFRLRSQVWSTLLNQWVSGDYVDLTGWTPSAQVRTGPGAADPPIASFICTLSDQVAFKGGVLLVLLPSVTVNMTSDSYLYDMQLKKDVDNVKTYLRGSINMTKEITRV